MATTHRGINIPVTGQIQDGDDIVEAMRALGFSTDVAISAAQLPEGEVDVTDGVVASLAANPSSDTGAAVRTTAVEAVEEANAAARSTTRTLYVRTTGNDSNDGTTTGKALRQISAAMNIIASYGPVLRGSWVIDVGAGSYSGNIRLPLVRGRSQDDYIKIVGPAVGGHPNVPTAVISYTSGDNWGILAENGTSLWLQDIKFTGEFPVASRNEGGVNLQLRNVHVDGAVVGISLTSHCRYFVHGGLIKNCDVGVQEHFNVVRAFSTVTSNAAQMTISDCDTGFKAKECCVGHLDYLNVQDCETGIELNGMCVANLKGVSLKRNTLGIANVNSEIHNATSVSYGTGADANTREYIAIGSAATDLTDLGWQEGPYARTEPTGHRPAITLAADYTDHTVTGVTTETTFVQLDSVVPPHRFNTAGKHLRVVVWGSVDTAVTTATGYRILLRIGGILTGEVRVPQSAVVGVDFKAEFDIVCSQDGNSQRVMSTISGFPDWTGSYALRTLDMTTLANQPVRLSAIPGNNSESVTLHLVEVWG